jgi:hypothetical protein
LKPIKHILLLLLLCTATATFAQVEFTAKVSKQSLGVNERLRVDFVMNQDGDNFVPPSFEGFNIVGGPQQAVNYQWINGQKSFSKTYSYFLAPKKRGAFTIGQASIQIEGTTYKTSPVKVTVTAAVQVPKDPNDPTYLAQENIHLVAEVSNSNPYLNEAVTVVYKLYVAPNISVNNLRTLDVPRYNDFWSQTQEIQKLKVENTTYKGEDYRVVTLRWAVLYPQKTGKLELEPLSLDLSVEVPTNRRDFFGGRLMKQVHQTVAAGSRTINVKPLPETGKPADFTGAVGDFDLKVTTTKTELNATESLQAALEISGNGNLKLFELPDLKAPNSLEVYEPEKSDKVRTTMSGMQGSRTETYTIVPQYKGKYPLPSVSFSYFDPKLKQYKTITSDELVIDVLEGPNNTSNNDATGSNVVSKQSVALNGKPFAYIKTDTEFTPINQTQFFKTKAFWLWLLMPLLLIPLALIIRRQQAIRQADFVGNKARQANRLAKKYLSSAKKSLGQKEAFYDALERALHNYLRAKLRIETSEFSKERIAELLSSRQVKSDTVKLFINVLERCELARYTPMTLVNMEEDYQKAVDAISNIDKQIK